VSGDGTVNANHTSGIPDNKPLHFQGRQLVFYDFGCQAGPVC
jgi:hypothetical protein